MSRCKYTQMYIKMYFLSISLAKTETYMHAKITGGEKTEIEKYPHSAFLFLSVYNGAFVCGASILDQKVLLTAAHCVSSCDINRCRIEVFAGNTNKRQGIKFKALEYKIHEEYDDKTVENDVGLIVLETNLPLGKYMKRVAIMRRPPPTATALVAGWGYIDETRNIGTEWLHHTKQTIWSLERCRAVLDEVPDGCICGGQRFSKGYVSKGDSGSALIIDDYIQVGIVSFKRPDITKSLVVYTDVTYFYDWIKRKTSELLCA